MASSDSKNGVEVQTINGLSTVAGNTSINQFVVNRKFGFMPLVLTIM